MPEITQGPRGIGRDKTPARGRSRASGTMGGPAREPVHGHLSSQAPGAVPGLKSDPKSTPKSDAKSGSISGSQSGPPLFLVGCVRSGTTLTRDLLRRVPGLICPEETHFLRWSEPFRTPASMPPHTQNAVLRRHREIDGVPEEVFAHLLRTSRSKAALQRAYMDAFAQARGITGPYRWFDKTPQNIYGGALILEAFPAARLVHILRNPLNVVASMIMGRQVTVPDVHGAINYWCEAVQIARTLQAAAPARVMHLRYEDLIADVPGTMERLLAFGDLNAPPGLYARSDAHRERNLWREALAPAQVRAVTERCSALAAPFGYDLAAQTRVAAGAV